MLMDKITLVEGATIDNMSIATGILFPTSPNVGEMFYRLDGAFVGTYVHNGTTWIKLSDGVWSGMTGTPTTLSGYGITDATPSSHLTDQVLHLTSGQNTWIDTITASAAEVNYLIGTTSAVQTQINSKLNLSGGTMTGSIVIPTGSHVSLADAPVSGTDAVNKNYVDGNLAGLSWKNSVIAATTENITLSAPQTIDGISILAGNRVLVKDQTTSSENGIYVANASSWIRATDMDSTTPINEVNSAAVFVEMGTTQQDTGWTQINPVSVLGTDAVSFAQFNGAVGITAGVGLAKFGNVLNVNLGAGVSQLPSDEVGIDVHASGGLMTSVDNSTSSTLTNAQLALTDVGTAGTYKSVTTDAKGRVTAGTNPTTLAGYGITDAAPISHVSDLTLHLTSSQNTWIDAITATSTQVNFLVGVTSAIQTQFGTKLNLSGGTITGNIIIQTGSHITLSDSPVNAGDAVNRNYIDAKPWKTSVRHATTTNITLSGTPTIDNAATSVGERILVKNQTTASENGIYVIAAGAWARATDMDANTTGQLEVNAAVIYVETGEVNVSTFWVQTEVNPTIGSSAINFSQFGNLGDITGNNNLIINGNFDVWQRATSQTATGMLSADRWNMEHVGTTDTTSLQSFSNGQTAVPNNPTYYCRHVIVAGGAAGDYALMSQPIENVLKLSGTKVTLSFWAKADANKTIAIDAYQGFGTGGSPSAVVAIIVGKYSITSSWSKVIAVIDIPSISGKTLGTDANSSKTYFRIWFDAGSSHDAATGTLGHQSGTFDIAQVKVEEGGMATKWQKQTLQEIQLECYRYYQSFVQFLISGYNTSSALIYEDFVFPIPMRNIPVAAFSSQNYSNTSAVATNDVEADHWRGQCTITTTGAGWATFNASFSAEIV